MEKQRKILMVLLRLIIAINVIGMLLAFMLALTNEKELAVNVVAIAGYTVLPIFLVAVYLDTKIRRA